VRGLVTSSVIGIGTVSYYSCSRGSCSCSSTDFDWDDCACAAVDSCCQTVTAAACAQGAMGFCSWTGNPVLQTEALAILMSTSTDWPVTASMTATNDGPCLCLLRTWPSCVAPSSSRRRRGTSHSRSRH